MSWPIGANDFNSCAIWANIYTTLCIYIGYIYACSYKILPWGATASQGRASDIWQVIVAFLIIIVKYLFVVRRHNLKITSTVLASMSIASSWKTERRTKVAGHYIVSTKINITMEVRKTKIKSNKATGERVKSWQTFEILIQFEGKWHVPRAAATFKPVSCDYVWTAIN